MKIFSFKFYSKIDTNAALSNWTMDGLLQINGNEPKLNTVCPVAPSPTKRTSLRSRTQQHCITETNNNVSHVNHKRPSTLESSINKRLKSNSTVSSFNLDNSSSTANGKIQPQSFPLQSQNGLQLQQSKSSHLLQHLMAPSPERVRKYTGPATKTSTDKLNTDPQAWASNIGYNEPNPQSSDSVLKNLLVSGCDISAGYVCQVPVRLRKLAKA